MYVLLNFLNDSGVLTSAFCRMLDWGVLIESKLTSKLLASFFGISRDCFELLCKLFVEIDFVASYLSG